MMSLAEFKQHAQAQFDQMGLPTKKVENWKYTDLSRFLADINLQPTAAAQKGKSAPTHAVKNAIKLVLIDGRLDVKASELDKLPQGVRIRSLSDQLKHDAKAVLQYFKQQAVDYSYHRMVALSHARLQDGVWLDIADNVQLSQPLHLIYQASGDGATGIANYSHIIQLGQHSHAVMIEENQINTDKQHIINSVTSIRCGSGSRLHYYQNQPRLEQVSHIANLQLWQQRDSSVYAFNATQGARLGRFDIHTRLLETGANCVFDGVFQLGNDSHADSHILVEHLASHTRSDVCYKGLANDHAHGVFNAKAIVHPHVKQVDAKQSNKNLLLSKHAAIDTKPELEIYADDLKCAHGATVGQLDQAELFYLQSRGIPENEAKAILTQAFCKDVMLRIPDAALRAWFDATAR